MVRTLMGRVNRPKNASTALLASTALASGTLGYGSVTRNTTGATYTDGYGVIRTAAANTPRINNSQYVGTNFVTNPGGVGAVVGGAFPTNWQGSQTAGGITTSIAGVGTENGIPYVDIAYTGTATTTGPMRSSPESIAANTYPAAFGQNWVASGYFKLVRGTIGALFNFSLEIRELIAGASSDVSGTVLPLSSTLTRYSYTRALTNAATTTVQPTFRIGYTVGAVADFVVRVGGIQMEYGSVASPLVLPPAGQLGPSSNYVQPRLLVEEQRTNSIRNPRAEGAATGTPGTAPTFWAIGLTAGVSVTTVATGTELGLPYVDYRFFGTPSATDTATRINFDTAVTAASSGQIWAGSVYVRLVGGSTAGISNFGLEIPYFDGASGFLGNVNQPFTPTAASQRVTAITSALPGTAASIRAIDINMSVTSGTPIDITLRVSGPQTELGPFPTSVILPPAGSPAVTTRNGDDIVIPTTGRVQFAASVTNTLLYGGDLNPLGWSVANAPTITTGQASPDGGTSAIEILTNSVANEGKYTFPATVVGRYYTQSVYLKNVSGATNVVVGNDFAPGATISCDLTTGNINARATSTISGNLVGMGNGWYRASVTFLATATSTSFIVYGIGGIGQRFLVWGAQHEVAPVTPSQNLLVAPEDLYFSSWTKAGATILPNSIAAPDGTLTADRIVEDTSTGSHGVWQAYVIPTPGQYTIKFYAKASERTQILMKGYNSTDGNAMAVWVDLSNGTTFYNSQGVVSVTAVGGGWYRITCTATFSAVYTQWFIVAASGGTDNYAGSTSAGLYVWGVQLSRGGVIDYVAANQLTSPQIYTVATAATRTRLASGTIVAKVKVPTAGPTNPSGIVAFTDGTSGLRAGLRFNLGNNNLTLFSFGSVNQANSVQLGSIPAAGTVITVAFAWSNGSMAAVYGGQYMTLGQPPQLGMVDMRLGESTPGGQFLNSELESVIYYPYRMSYQQLLTVTS